MKRKMLLIPLALLLAVSLVATGCPAPAPPTAPEAEAEIAKLEAEIAKLESSAKSNEAEITKLQKDLAAAKKVVAPEVFEITVTSHVPPANVYGAGSIDTFNLLEERTGGAIRVKEATYSQALVKVGDSLKSCGRGIVDVITCGAVGYYPAEQPLIALTEMPYLCGGICSNPPTCLQLYDQWAPFREEFTGNNVAALWCSPGMPMTIISNQDVRTIDDLKGQRLRAYGLTGEIVEKLGGTAVGIAFSEIYTSMERGTIDGAAGVAFGNLPGLQTYPVTKTNIDPGIGVYTSLFVYMNLDVYNSLPDFIKMAIRDLRSDHVRLCVDRIMQYESEAKADIEKYENEVWMLNPEEAAEFRARVNPEGLWESHIQAVEDLGLPGRELAARFQKLIEYYELFGECPYVPIFK